MRYPERLKVILYFCLYSCTAIAQSKPGVPESKKSFGEVKQGDPVSLSYEIRNEGDVPLIFENYEVSCSCTTAELPQAPVLPGKSATIVVRFKTDAAIGLQDRIVKVFIAGRKHPVKLRFRGTVLERSH